MNIRFSQIPLTDFQMKSLTQLQATTTQTMLIPSRLLNQQPTHTWSSKSVQVAMYNSYDKKWYFSHQKDIPNVIISDTLRCIDPS